MPYISATHVDDQVIVWERDDSGQRIVRDYPAPYYFYYDDKDGEYTTIFDTPVSKREFTKQSKYRAARKEYESDGVRMWETDISPEIRVLSNHYYGLPAPKLHVTFFDIEVDYDPQIGFSSITNPYAPINSVAILHSWKNELVVIVVPPEAGWNAKRLEYEVNKVEPIPSKFTTRYIICEDEAELLLCLLSEFKDSDVLSGWNCVPIDQSVWTTNRIIPLKNVEVGQHLATSTVHEIFPQTTKSEFKILTATGHTVRSSIDHKYFVKIHPIGKYTDLHNVPVVELSIKQMQPLLSTHSIFIQQLLRTNTNPNIPDITLDQLYLAGLIYTDGTLTDPTDRNSGFRIFQSDVHLLENLPLVTTSIVGPHKNCYSIGIKSSLIPRFVRSLIYNNSTKQLNLEEISKLSYTQFCSFLAGLLDGDGYVSTGGIEWCNYNNDISCLAELCTWNGIIVTQPVKGTTPRLRILSNIRESLPLKKQSRWNRLTSHTDRTNTTKALSEKIKYRRIGDRIFSRIYDISNTGQTVEMIDIGTSNHQFITSGVVVHNCDLFDIPYVAQRITRTLDNQFIDLSTTESIAPNGKVSLAYVDNPNNKISQSPGKFRCFKQLDFPTFGKPSWRVVTTIAGKLMGHTVDLVGRVRLDYLNLYKKYEPGERASYKLAAIADLVLVDEKTKEPILPKMEYEGSLADLYRQNFAFFVRYNIRDTEILDGFETKLGYVEIANQNCHLSTALFSHVGGTLKLAELALINYCHHTLKRVVKNVTEPEIDRQIDGALVLYPQVGMHEFVGSIDITSLYPTAIRSLNISPETIRGQFEGCELDFHEIASGTSMKLLTLVFEGDKRSVTKSAEDWREYFIERKWAVSGYGTVFDQTKMGFIPALLGEWFALRMKYQKMKKEAIVAGDSDKAGYYDRLQYVYKIKLNSLYGALSNLYFRFYDLRMGESTTGSGRAILRHQCRTVAKILDGKYDVDFPMYDTIKDAMETGYTEDEARSISLHGPRFNGKHESNTVVYGDTDSVYFKTYAENAEDAIMIADAVAAKVNQSYQPFMAQTFLCTPGYDNLVKCGREVVVDRGIFVEKKRYILHLVDLDGKKVDKMKIMGLDTKKTTLPAHVSAELNAFIERFLKGESWDSVAVTIVDYKEKLSKSEDVTLIGLPKGVRGIEEYTGKYADDAGARLPGHVAASIYYNECLVEYKDKVSQPIISGMKIKVYYLKGKHGKFKSIALPTDIEVVPSWFLENFVVDRVAHIERLVDNPLSNILKAIGKTPPSAQSLLVDSLLSF